MDDELIPICEQFGVNLITSTGFQSITGAIAMFSRAGSALPTIFTVHGRGCSR